MSFKRSLGAILLVALTFGFTSAAHAQQGDAPGSAEELETATPIKHLITVMQENHTFDNYFGEYPGADGVPDDVCMPLLLDDPDAGCAERYHLANKAIIDLGHSDDVFVDQYNDGAMDGFADAFASRSPNAAEQTMGYYDDRDLPYYWNIADEYVLFDRFFTSAAGGSVRNHFYWIAGAPGNEEEDALKPEGFNDVPTIFDSLQESGVSWKFYVQNLDLDINYRNTVEGSQAGQLIWAPVLNYDRFLDDPELSSRIVPLEEFFDDLANDTLPAVSYMLPSGASEHPPGSIQAGERFIRSLITGIMRSSAWDSSAFIWTYDDWGGWYDHVKPPQVDKFGYGFRAPALLVSSYAKRGHIDSTTLDFTSILKFIEENWGIEPLAERDAAANTFMDAFDFEAGPREAILLDREREVVPTAKPRSGVVYGAYGGALGVALLLIAIGVGGTVMSRRRTERNQQSAAT